MLSQKPKRTPSPSRVLRRLEKFLSGVVRRGRNASVPTRRIAGALAHAALHHLSPSEAAEDMGFSHSTLSRVLAKADPRAVARWLAATARRLARGLPVLVDVTVLRAPGSLAPWSRGGRLEVLVLYSPGRLAVAAGLRNAFRGLDELLREALRLARPGSVLVADAEFSSRKCMRVLLEALDAGLIAGFLVRANRRWWPGPWGMAARGSPAAFVWRRHTLYAWRSTLETRDGRVEALFISSSPSLGPGLYARRWRVETFFRSAKSLMPPHELRRPQSVLLLFAVCCLLALMLEDKPELRRSLRRLLMARVLGVASVKPNEPTLGLLRRLMAAAARLLGLR